MTKIGNIRTNGALRNKRGRRVKPVGTPAEEKESWAKRALEKEGGKEWIRMEGKRGEWRAKRLTEGWGDSAWQAVRTAYQAGVPEPGRTPAQGPEDWRTRRELHRNLTKAESSTLIQMRTEKIRFAHFLFRRRVPGIQSASCECGWPKQDIKHILIFCPRLGQYRPILLESAGTSDLRKMLITPKGARASSNGLLTLVYQGNTLLQESNYPKERRPRRR